MLVLTIEAQGELTLANAEACGREQFSVENIRQHLALLVNLVEIGGFFA